MRKLSDFEFADFPLGEMRIESWKKSRFWWKFFENFLFFFWY